MIRNEEMGERLDKMVETKRLNIMAQNQVTEYDEKKEQPKIKFSALKKVASEAKKKPKSKAPIDLRKMSVNDYHYKEFSKTLETILPCVVNQYTFGDEEFKTKLSKSKDLKHFLNEKVQLSVTNDFVGAGLTIAGLALEHYLGKVGVKIEPPKPSKKAGGKKKEAEENDIEDEED